MGPETRKQREIQRREAQILDVARRMLAEEGYLKLNMDRIAREIEYAKGTVYQHFRNKEDIVLALDLVTHRTMEALFRRAASFDGGTRQRMTAVGVASNLINLLCPDHLRISRVTCNPAIFEKACQQRQEALRAAESACIHVLVEIVQQARAWGDLELPPDSAPEDLVFGLWALTEGAYALVETGIPLLQNGIRDPMQALWQNLALLLDGYHWRPLSTDEDYHATRLRAWHALFAQDYPDHVPSWAKGGPPCFETYRPAS
jgi:AcrR family transcriptional regulator